MINEVHDFGFCITVEIFPKSKICRHPNCYTEELAVKGRRKQEVKEIGRVCGVTKVVEC
jgi:hypothetical protein